jgi:hypothetical protein
MPASREIWRANGGGENGSLSQSRCAPSAVHASRQRRAPSSVAAASSSLRPARPRAAARLLGGATHGEGDGVLRDEPGRADNKERERKELPAVFPAVLRSRKVANEGGQKGECDHEDRRGGVDRGQRESAAWRARGRGAWSQAARGAGLRAAGNDGRGPTQAAEEGVGRCSCQQGLLWPCPGAPRDTTCRGPNGALQPGARDRADQRRRHEDNRDGAPLPRRSVGGRCHEAPGIGGGV